MTHREPRMLELRTGEDRTVRLLDGRTLSPGSEKVDVPWSLYVQRRLECGDLIDDAAEAAKAEAAKAEAAKIAAGDTKAAAPAAPPPAAPARAQIAAPATSQGAAP